MCSEWCGVAGVLSLTLREGRCCHRPARSAPFFILLGRKFYNLELYEKQQAAKAAKGGKVDKVRAAWCLAAAAPAAYVLLSVLCHHLNPLLIMCSPRRWSAILLWMTRRSARRSWQRSGRGCRRSGCSRYVCG